MIEISPESAQALFIEMLYNEQQLATGTAFICAVGNNRILVTNRHNFTCRSQVTDQPLYGHGGIPNKIRVWLHESSKLGKFSPVDYPILSKNDEPLWVEHPVLGKAADIGGLRVVIPDGLSCYPVDLNEPSNSPIIRPAEILSVVGYPFGLSGGKSFAIWATGFVASEPELNYQDLPVFLIDCRSRGGQSGSPVFAVRSGSYSTSTAALVAGSTSVFLGVYSGRINIESDLGKVWKRRAVRELVMNMSFNIELSSGYSVLSPQQISDPRAESL